MKVISSVLIVDDNEADRFLCEDAITRTAADSFPCIYTACDGEKALELFEQYEASQANRPKTFPPKLILLDVNMPKVDGFEFLERFSQLRTDQNDCTSIVLMLTSSSDDRDKLRAANYEFVRGFLVKPPSKNDIAAILERFGEEIELS